MTAYVIDPDCLTCGGEGYVPGWEPDSELMCPACVLRERGVTVEYPLSPWGQVATDAASAAPSAAATDGEGSLPMHGGARSSAEGAADGATGSMESRHSVPVAPGTRGAA